MVVTRHGKTRIKQRVHIGKSERKVNRVAQLALDRGINRSQTKGLLRSYLDDQILFHECGNNLKVYNGKIWVFENEKLITVKSLPNHLKHKVKQLTKESE